MKNPVIMITVGNQKMLVVKKKLRKTNGLIAYDFW